MKVINCHYSALPISIGSGDSHDAIILFVHGFLSDNNTWTPFVNLLQKSWAQEFQYSIRYFASKTLRRRISHESALLKKLIDSECDKYKYIIIIAHSMGGLISRQYLVDEIELNNKIKKIKSLITYATPHYGSFWATMGMWLTLKINPKLKDLSSNNKYLKILNEKWDGYKINDKIKFIRVVAKNDMVVNEESASYIGEEHNVYNLPYGHLGIIRPKNFDDAAFQIAYKHLTEISVEIMQDELNTEESMDDILEDDSIIS